MSYQEDLLHEQLDAVYRLLIDEADRINERLGKKIEIVAIAKDPILTVKDSTLIRIPRALKTALHEEAEYLMESYRAGESDLPPEYRERVPLHYVIKRALEVGCGRREDREAES